MSEQDQASDLDRRFDDFADGYQRWWGPVIAPEALRVLDLLAPAVAAGRADAHLLDVGTGTGTLAIAALERWPSLRVSGIDPSGAMLEVGRTAARARLGDAGAARYDQAVAGAEQLPFGDGSIDLAMSSFALQLVPNRSAALREIRRVLAPGATFAWISWLRTDRQYEPDRVANEVLDDAGFDPPEPGDRGGDFTSRGSTVATMRRAGFVGVRASRSELAHAWSPEGYVEFFTRYDEQSLFADLEPDERAEIEARILDGVRRLPQDALVLRLPTISIVGRVPVG